MRAARRPGRALCEARCINPAPRCMASTPYTCVGLCEAAAPAAAARTDASTASTGHCHLSTLLVGTGLGMAPRLGAGSSSKRLHCLPRCEHFGHDAGHPCQASSPAIQPWSVVNRGRVVVQAAGHQATWTDGTDRIEHALRSWKRCSGASRPSDLFPARLRRLLAACPRSPP